MTKEKARKFIGLSTSLIVRSLTVSPKMGDYCLTKEHDKVEVFKKGRKVAELSKSKLKEFLR